jgi:TetR/AcrR family transcriptional repressor of nem operon
MATDTRNRILEVAARLFAEHGYHATGVADILRVGGVKSGSLYHFFSSKEDLLVAVMKHHLDSLEPGLLKRAVTESQTNDPLDHIFSLLGIYRRILTVSGATLGCPVGSITLEVGRSIPRVRLLTEQYFTAWVTQVRAWLDQAGSRLPTSLDRDAFARQILAVTQGSIIQAQAAKSVDPYDTCVSQLRANIELLLARSRYEHGETRDVLEGEPALADRSGGVDTGDQFEWRAW